MGVGEGNPCALMVARRYSGNPASSNVVTGLGTSRPDTCHDKFTPVSLAVKDAVQRTTDDDLLVISELQYFSHAAGGDPFIFDVEILLKLGKVLRAPVYIAEVSPQCAVAFIV
jgi:hypothetical protein